MPMSKLIPQPLRRPAVVAQLIGVAVFLVLAFVRHAGHLQPLELAAYDAYLNLRPVVRKAEPRVVLICVTDEDIQRLGQWPLSDETLATILEILRDYGPRAIGFDIYRDLAVPPGIRRLERVLTSSDAIVAVDKFGDETGPGVPPPPVLTGTDRIGFSDVVLDPGGAVRRALLFLDDGTNVSASLALRLALLYLAHEGVAPLPGESDPRHLRLGRVTLPPFESNDGGYANVDARGYQFLLDFRGGRTPFPTYSVTQLLQGHVPDTAVHDKVVLVGVTADTGSDHFLTPFSRTDTKTSSGMALHARATDQLLRMALDGDRPLSFMSDMGEQAWILFWSMLGAAFAWRIRSLLRFTLLAALVTGLLGILTYAAFLAGWWIPVVPTAIAWLSSATLVMAYLSGQEMAEKRSLMQLFAKHVSRDVAEELWRAREEFLRGGRLQARTLTATVLFSDLENFTPVAEKLAPERLMEWLNEYMDTMAGVVMDHHGVVDDFYGDAIKANFGVPVARIDESDTDQDARNAVACAMAMARALGRLNRFWSGQGMPCLRMRVGIATGPVVAGCLGSAQRMKYTTLGDVVNVAARLEGYRKEAHTDDVAGHPCRVLMAEQTVRRLGERYQVAQVGTLSLKGKDREVTVYRLLAEAPGEDVEPATAAPAQGVVSGPGPSASAPGTGMP
jgi:adenylate cyclase